MSYPEIWNAMTKSERVACRLMCWMKVDTDGYWKVCLRNKILSKIASLILKENVFDWQIQLAEKLDDCSAEEVATLKMEMATLKQALN